MMSLQHRVAVSSVLALLAAGVSCGGGGACPVSNPNCESQTQNPSVTGVTISGAPSTAIAVGQTAQVTASVTVTGGAAQTVAWTSDNPAVATVSAANPTTVTAIAPGTTNITARSTVDGTKFATAPITVAGVSTVALNVTAPQTIQIGQTTTLTANVATFGGVASTVTWKSSNTNVATVTPSGNTASVKGLASGTATVTATSSVDGQKSAALVFTVVAAQPVANWTPGKVAIVGGPMTGAVTGMWGSGTSSVFAVTDNGEIAHYDGTRWQSSLSGKNPFNGVFGNSASDVFAVGNGSLFHFDGTNWTSQTIPVSSKLFAVWSASSSTAFAVGQSGTIIRLTGGTWSTMTSPTAQDLHGVFGFGASDVYAVGSGGVILHFDGTTWTSMSSGTSQTLRGVWGTSTANVFAVGEGGTILHFNGSVWGAMSSGTTGVLTAVSGAGTSDVYATLANGSLLTFNGTSWGPSGIALTFAGTLNYRDSVLAVWDAGASVAFLGGSEGMTGIYRPPGNSLAGMTLLSLNPTLESVQQFGNVDVVVGTYGTIQQFDGTSWTAVNSPTSGTLLGLSPPFAVGAGGTILRFSGNAWTGMTSPVTADLN